MRRGRQTDLAPWSGGSMSPDMFFNVSPWQMMRRIQEDMDRVFSQFLAEPSGAQGGQQADIAQWAPRMDVSETDREWTIHVELPGVQEEDIDIAVQDHHLIIRAELREEEEAPAGQAQGGQAQGGQPQGGQGQAGQPQAGQAQGGQAQGGQPRGQQTPQRQYYYRERRFGYFERVLRLPENVDEDQIRCEFRNGVLTLHVPKAEPARPEGRRIAVGAGAQGEQRQGNGRGQQQREPAMAGTRGGEASSPEQSSTEQSKPEQSKPEQSSQGKTSSR